MKRDLHHRALFALLALALLPEAASAGMPIVRLSDVARLRFQSLSFFLLLFLLSTLLVYFVWNALARDFPRLPRLTYRRALGLVGLWGFLFVLVLTMISGARELLTPGAWEPAGRTYKLADASIRSARMTKAQALKAALWEYAHAHAGAFPASDLDSGVSPAAWETGDPSRVRFIYIPRDPVQSDPLRILAHEPPALADDIWVIYTDGAVMNIPSHTLLSARVQATPHSATQGSAP